MPVASKSILGQHTPTLPPTKQPPLNQSNPTKSIYDILLSEDDDIDLLGDDLTLTQPIVSDSDPLKSYLGPLGGTCCFPTACSGSN
jgi:hypothetical protein